MRCRHNVPSLIFLVKEIGTALHILVCRCMCPSLTALLLKADIEMALGNVDNMEIYEKKALAIDPNAFFNTKE